MTFHLKTGWYSHHKTNLTEFVKYGELRYFKLVFIMKFLNRLILCLICFLIIVVFCSCEKEKDIIKETESQISVITEEISANQVDGFEEKKPENSQVGIIVDSWLKIISIGEKDGVLSVFVRNTSDKDIQYALLTVSVNGEKAEFPITTLTAGASTILRCQNGFAYSDKTSYYGWKISDKVVFNGKLTCHPEVFEIEGVDGFISVKNISDKDIDGKIYIYYKNVTDGVYDDGVTYRAYVDGLKKGEKTQIQTQHYLKDVSHIMFVEYAE